MLNARVGQQPLVIGLAQDEHRRHRHGNQAEAQKQFTAFVDSAVKNAPKGTEQAVAALQSAVATAGTAFESVQKAVKQASEQAAASIDTMTHGALNAATTTVTDVKAKKAA